MACTINTKIIDGITCDYKLLFLSGYTACTLIIKCMFSFFFQVSSYHRPCYLQCEQLGINPTGICIIR
jgi:hypothetical protein